MTAAVRHRWTLIAIWLALAVELVSPVPGPLTLGAAYVLAVRPAWFRRFVDRLYEIA